MDEEVCAKLTQSPFFGTDPDIQQSFDAISVPAISVPAISFPSDNVITVAFCDWWHSEYCGGTFNPHDNFFINLIKTHCGGNISINAIDPSQNPDILFYSVFGNSAYHYKARRKVFFSGESLPHRTDADFNITFDASNAINVRLPLWVCYLSLIHI